MTGTYEQFIFQMRVSELYFIKGKNQKEIAQMMGCSIATVSRALKTARENGVIEIRIKNPLEEVNKLEKELMQRYDLKKVIVVRGIYKEPETSYKVIGIAAAELAVNIIQPGELVGITSGRTIYEMIKSFPLFGKRINIEVVPLIGGLGISDAQYQINELARMFADSFQGTASMLNAPVIVKEKRTRDLLLEEKTIAVVTEKWKILDKVIVSIGLPPTQSPPLNYWYSSLNKEDKNFILKNSVGDICGRFFNNKGEECLTEISNRIISLDLKQIKKIDTRIGLVAGRGKVEGTKAALLNGLINILVTGEETAKGILAKS